MESRSTMESSIASLSRLQISTFFSSSGCPSQQQCDEKARSLTGECPTPTPVQGGSSYTVIAGEYVVQFRAAHAVLDLEFLGFVEKAYDGFIPWHRASGTLGNLYVYMMQNVGGICMYLARDSLHRNGCHLLRQTLTDFARFFASAWNKTPETLPLPDRQSLYSKYISQLVQLSTGLPQRFGSVLDRLIHRLPYLIGADWPLVPNHDDLLENNIHVNPDTGKLVGICDWAGTEISPFGMSLGWVENILGIAKLNGHAYHANHEELRGLFYEELYHAMGGVSAKDRERMEDARLVGLFLTNGWRCDTYGTLVPAEEGEPNLCYLDAVLRTTCEGY